MRIHSISSNAILRVQQEGQQSGDRLAGCSCMDSSSNCVERKTSEPVFEVVVFIFDYREKGRWGWRLTHLTDSGGEKGLWATVCLGMHSSCNETKPK